MTRKPTAKQQDEAYDHGYRSCQFREAGRPYRNPYDSDRFWLLFMAYEQGWNDRREWEVSRGAVSR
jgi:hypothetical protein